MKILLKLISPLLLLCCLLSGDALAFQGKVVGISDGDTITIMNNGIGEKIRLYGVDCPEKGQDFGKRAKHFTSDMVFGKIVTVDTVVKDRFGRTVGIVKVSGRCLSEEIIRSGMGWLYRKYCDKPICRQWSILEGQARSSKVGLWSHPNPTPPWEFRHPNKKTASSLNFSSGSVAQGVFHGNSSSRIFHAPSCAAYNCKNCTVIFQNSKEALAAGYRPCGKCRPQ